MIIPRLDQILLYWYRRKLVMQDDHPIITPFSPHFLHWASRSCTSFVRLKSNYAHRFSQFSTWYCHSFFFLVLRFVFFFFLCLPFFSSFDNLKIIYPFWSLVIRTFVLSLLFLLDFETLPHPLFFRFPPYPPSIPLPPSPLHPWVVWLSLPLSYLFFSLFSLNSAFFWPCWTSIIQLPH